MKLLPIFTSVGFYSVVAGVVNFSLIFLVLFAPRFWPETIPFLQDNKNLLFFPAAISLLLVLFAWLWNESFHDDD